MTMGTLTITIRTDNDAMVDPHPGMEVARLLRDQAYHLEAWPYHDQDPLGPRTRSLLDYNGNTVGTVTYTPSGEGLGEDDDQ